MWPSSASTQESEESVRALQQKIRDAGIPIKIDGKMGKDTRDAMILYESKRAAQEQRDIERMKAEAEARKAKAEETAAENAVTMEANRVKERAAGAGRLQDLYEREQTPFSIPWFRSIARDYGPSLGYLAGAAGGFMLRKNMIKGADAAALAKAQQAEQGMAGAPVGTPVTASDVAARFPRVNEFWSRGGAAEMPFQAAPGTRAGIQANPNAPQANTLYPAPSGFRRSDAMPLVPMGMDVGMGTWGKLAADKELQAAQEALAKDPSEANIQRVQVAKDLVGVAKFATNLGYGAFAGYSGESLLKGPKGIRPSTAAAESERAAVDQFMRTANRNRGGMQAPGAPAPLSPAGTLLESPVGGMPGHTRTPWGIRGPNGRFVSMPGE
jgi:hypothetical protein